MRGRPKNYIREIEEMRAHGLVTNLELAGKWGVGEHICRYYSRKGKLPKAFWNQEIKTWFYHTDSQKPAGTSQYRPRSVAIKTFWSMWPAPNTKPSLGWLGADRPILPTL